MKRLFFALLLFATMAGYAYDFQSGDFYYNITSETTVEVNEAEWLITTATIPETVTYSGNTYSVTRIGDYAFWNHISLTSVTIPNSVESIGSGAFFDCPSLTSVTIPNSVTSIGDNAFLDCSSLTSITIPNSVTTIGYCAFSYCTSLTSPVYNAHCFAYMPTSFVDAYTIPDGIKQIAGGAFSSCTSLTSVTIPNSVESIGGGAFQDCSSLTSMVVESGNIKYDSRDNCNAIIETATNILIAGCQNTIIPNSVTSIGDEAFYYCSSLTSITIPNSVTSIGSRAFLGCSSLTSITCEAETPPTVRAVSAFHEVDESIPVYVPCGSEKV